MVKAILFVVSFVVYTFASAFIIGAGTFTPYECFSIAMSMLLTMGFVLTTFFAGLVCTVMISIGEEA